MGELFHSAIDTLFGCRHSNQSRPFTLRRHTYKVCLDCGKEISYSLAPMSPIKGGNYANPGSAAQAAKVGAL